MKHILIACLLFLNLSCKSHTISENVKSDKREVDTSVAGRISDSLLPTSNPYCVFIQYDSVLGYIDIRPFDIEGGVSNRNYYRNVSKYEQIGIYTHPFSWSNNNPGVPILKKYHVNGIDYNICIGITEKESNLTVYVNNKKKIQCYLGESYSQVYFVDEVIIHTDNKSFDIIGNFKDKRIDISYPYSKVMDTTVVDDQFLLNSYNKR